MVLPSHGFVEQSFHVEIFTYPGCHFTAMRTFASFGDLYLTKAQFVRRFMVAGWCTTFLLILVQFGCAVLENERFCMFDDVFLTFVVFSEAELRLKLCNFQRNAKAEKFGPTKQKYEDSEN